MSIQFETLKDEYTQLLAEMQVKDTWKQKYDRRARQILAFRSKYEEVEDKTGVPWQMVAAIHERESSCDFRTHLHNGDSLLRRTYHVPAGRPLGNPPFTWIESAVDALQMKGLHKITDWSDERVCYEMERYNGFGYRQYHPRTLSPYLWSGTNHYASGKYVADGQWSSSAVDPQLGVVPLYFKLKELSGEDVKTKLTRQDKKELTENSTKLTFINRVLNFIKVAVATILGFDYMGFLEQIKQVAADNKVLTILLVGGFSYALFKILENYVFRDYMDGRWTPSGMADQPSKEESVENVQS